MIARAATWSSRNNQKLLFKEGLEELWALARVQGALGVNVAHSGTVLGVLWPEDFPDRNLRQIDLMVQQRFPLLTLQMQTALRGGGVEVAGEKGDYVELFKGNSRREGLV